MKKEIAVADHIEIAKHVHGLCYMIVCCTKGFSDKEILEFCNANNPSGTTNGWSEVIREDAPIKSQRPVPCSAHPNRQHIMVGC